MKENKKEKKGTKEWLCFKVILNCDKCNLEFNYVALKFEELNF